MISIIIPVYNCYEYTLECIRSIKECTREEHEIILVDNGSTDETQLLSRAADLGYDQYTRNEENRGFPAAVNQGARIAKGMHLCVLNNDVIVTPGWLERLLFHITDLGADIVGPCSNYVAGAQQVRIGLYESEEELRQRANEHYREHKHIQEHVNWLIGVCILMHTVIFHVLGGFDEIFDLGNSEDLDFCFKARKEGYVVAIARDVYIHHYGGMTHKELGLDYGKLLKENHDKLVAKWGSDVEDQRSEG